VPQAGPWPNLAVVSPCQRGVRSGLAALVHGSSGPPGMASDVQRRRVRTAMAVLLIARVSCPWPQELGEGKRGGVE